MRPARFFHITYFKMKTQVVHEILWNYFSNKRRDLKKQQQGSPRFFQLTSKTKHKGPPRFFHIASKKYTEIFPRFLQITSKGRHHESRKFEIIWNYFKSKTRYFRNSFKLLQNSDTNGPEIFSDHFKNKIQVISAVLSNYFKNKIHSDPQDYFKLP